MRLVPKQWDEYNPVLVVMGIVFAVAGGYGLMIPGPPIVWLIRGIFVAFFGIGLLVLIRQFQLRRSGEQGARDQKRYKQFNPIQAAMAVVWTGTCVYTLLTMGASGSLIDWLLRAILVAFLALGLTTLIRQFRLWTGGRIAK